MCLAPPASSAQRCQGLWPWASAHRTQASVVDACSARAAGSSPSGHRVGARAKGPSVRPVSCRGEAGGSLCQLLKQFLPPSPCWYHGAASEGWGVCPPPMGSVSSGCSILEAVWQGGHTWVVGPDWSPVPVPPLLRDLLVSSALDIDSRCVLVFVKVNE